MLTAEELADVIRLLRAQRSWSQEQLAAISKRSVRTVQRVEDGAGASLDTRRALAVAFEIDDIDAFNKPHKFLTTEEIEAAKAKFERERIQLPAVTVTNGKQLGRLVEDARATHFTEGHQDLTGPSADAFARIADYCREYVDYAADVGRTERLNVYEELDGFVQELKASGYSIVAANSPSTELTFGTGQHTMTVLFAVAFPVGKEPDRMAVHRRLRVR